MTHCDIMHPCFTVISNSSISLWCHIALFNMTSQSHDSLYHHAAMSHWRQMAVPPCVVTQPCFTVTSQRHDSLWHHRAKVMLRLGFNLACPPSLFCFQAASLRRLLDTQRLPATSSAPRGQPPTVRCTESYAITCYTRTEIYAKFIILALWLLNMSFWHCTENMLYLHWDCQIGLYFD